MARVIYCPECNSDALSVKHTVDAYAEIEGVDKNGYVWSGSTEYGDDLEIDADADGKATLCCSECGHEWKDKKARE